MTPSSISVGYVVKRYPRLSETFILNEVIGLEERGITVTVLALKRPGDGRFHEKLAHVRGEVHYAPEVRSNAMIDFLRSRLPGIAGLEPSISEMFWESLERSDPEGLEALIPAIAFLDVVREKGIRHLHAHFATVSAAAAMRLARLAGIGFSMTAHAKDIFHASVDPVLLAEKLHRAEFVVAVSDWTKEHLVRLGGPGAADKVKRIYNGLDLEEFPEPGVTRDNRQPIVSSIGRLVPKKGFDVLLDALSILRSAGREVRAEIIGEGELRDELRQRIATLGLGDLVTLHGAASHGAVRDLLCRSQVFALPARVAADGNRDGLPVAVVEAMASGVPVISTPVVGIPEAVEDGVTGLLVPENDPRALADAILRLLNEPGLRHRFAQAGRRRVEERFDLRKSAAAMEGLLVGALRKREAREHAVAPDAGGSETSRAPVRTEEMRR